MLSGGTVMWDVFISHAWEDKEIIARPLAYALVKAGLKIWYDEFTLKLGDSLRSSIDYGLSQSRYGVVILSPYFFAKKWPQRELDGLVAREVSSKNVILPVWHNITQKNVERFSPVLADRLSVSTANGLNIVVREIISVVHPQALKDSEKRINAQIRYGKTIEICEEKKKEKSLKRTQDKSISTSRQKISQMIKTLDKKLTKRDKNRLEAAMSYSGYSYSWRTWIRKHAEYREKDQMYRITMPWPFSTKVDPKIEKAFRASGFVVSFQ